MSFIFCVLGGVTALAQEPAAKPELPSSPSEKSASDKPAAKTEEKAAFPFQIELLETHVRFEANGDSRKDVHTIVKINDPAGARQFARLGFDYNRGFQSVEIPQVKITHGNGGTSEILPSAITDAPNPAVEKFPAYQDVRVKSVRILGLQEGDTLEYRVITTTTKPPLAPDYWLEHSFDRSGQVLEEDYELDLPGKLDSTSRMFLTWEGPPPTVYLGVPPTSYENLREPIEFRSIFRWKLTDGKKIAPILGKDGLPLPDLLVTSFLTWEWFAKTINGHQPEWTEENQREAETQMGTSWAVAKTPGDKLRAGYGWVSKKLVTVDLPLAATGYLIRPFREIIESGYATPEEKCFVLAKIANKAARRGEVVFHGTSNTPSEYPRPSAFGRAFVYATDNNNSFGLDPSLEVAPFGLVPAEFRGKPVLSLMPHDAGDYSYNWIALPDGFPFSAKQSVQIEAEIAGDGMLKARAKYELRGDNELVLRMAFHQTPKEGWNEVAGLLALADGFRGHIESVKASDPMETEKPFEVEYEITQPKFVDWSKKPVRIPALLPQIALPDAPGKSAASGKIELGTPLEVETRLTLRLPEGTAVQTPPGTSVARDYATYASKYEGHLNTLTASRHVHFLMRELPVERAADYGAFVRAVQLDQAQVITLFPPEQRERRK